MPPRWPKTTIPTPEGERVAVAPIIVSASRSTDIPAFHGDWLLRRLEAGYSVWTNPFSGTKQYVSFEKARAFVFWSKNPAPMLPKLEELDRYGFVYYFQFTLNDYEKENLEPFVPPLDERIETFRKLSQTLGKDRVLWRCDPILLTGTLSVDGVLNRIRGIGDKIAPFTEKLVFSYIDITAYSKVRRNLLRQSVPAREPSEEEMLELAAKLSEMTRSWNIRLATCAETIDFDRYGIDRHRCIDPELLLRIGKQDRELLSFLTMGRNLLPGLEPDWNLLKDPGQRKACGCVMSKDIGRYDTCPHGCAYCYANTSPEIVGKNMLHTDPFSESIVGTPPEE